ncbi:hypothetical protein, partial [Halomonas sp. ND22Bw]|uniref:hypothetical protein n=1 Tax=Halomonas sp. ND22Bw TaxID=2054178 RepID=UPI001C624A6F
YSTVMEVTRLFLMIVGSVAGMVLSMSSNASAAVDAEYPPRLNREQLRPLYDGLCDWPVRRPNENASAYVGRSARGADAETSLDLDCLDREFGTEGRFGSSEIRH